MASISSQLRMNDGMSPVLRRIKQSMDRVIGSFETMQRVSRTAVDSSAVSAAEAQYQKMDNTLNEISGSLNDMINRQQQFNNRLDDGCNKAGSLWSKLKGAAAAIGVGKGITELSGLSDNMANAQARLNLIVDDGGSVQQLQDKIFASAQASRGSYLDVMNTVSKLGILAGKAFSNNDETIKFAELMNKNFIIAGASAQEQSSAMYQLTQAMASGRLQGDEYRSIIENAPLLKTSIEEYMQNAGVEGTMKDWAADGMLTADVIKNALFSSADEIEERFSQMPMTWGQVWNDITNRGTKALEPVLAKINAFANSELLRSMIDNILNGFNALSAAASAAFDVLVSIAAFIQGNWSMIAPIILGVVAALAAFKIQTLLAAAAQGALTLAKMLAVPVYSLLNRTTMAATASQWGLNSALYACPIVWIIILLIALIAITYAVVAAVNQVTGSTTSATGIICGVVMSALAFIGNLFIDFYNFLLLPVVVAIWNVFADVANFVGNVFIDPVGSVARLFFGLCDSVLSVLQTTASAIDAVFGSNLAAGIQGWRDDLGGWVDKTFGKGQEVMAKIKGEDLLIERIDYGSAWNLGYNFGQGIDNKISGLFSGSDSGLDLSGDDSGLSGNYDYVPSAIDGIADDTDTIASNTGTSDENLKILREIAEREAINRFTTAEVKVDMTGMSNTISSDMDIDGFMNVFTGKLEEALLISAEGVHA